MALILNQSQAQAVYDAMVALNNVGGRMKAVLGTKKVVQYDTGVIVTSELLAGGSWEPCERFQSQVEFAAAYGLN